MKKIVIIGIAAIVIIGGAVTSIKNYVANKVTAATTAQASTTAPPTTVLTLQQQIQEAVASAVAPLETQISQLQYTENQILAGQTQH